MTALLSDYHYDFPEELVAQEPLAERDASRMMILNPQKKSVRHSRFRDLPEFLSAGDLLVVNDTAVEARRFFAKKPTGGKVEILLIRPYGPLEWSAFISPVRGLKSGMSLQLFSREKNVTLPLSMTVTSLEFGETRIRFPDGGVEEEILNQHGEMPLPPYIKRDFPRSEDRHRYQTFFAKNSGAVAAPTAGLHFTEGFRELLRQRGVHWATLTLHVGPGTFLPVKTEDIREHTMHQEWYEISDTTQRALQECRDRGNRIVAVGTTVLRAVETWEATRNSRGWTNLYITPGYEFRMVDALLTNFHQPRSTLLILVSALAGREFILQAYHEAIQEGYRLFSYGDCMLIEGGKRK